MIIGKLDADGWKIKKVDISEREPIFCEVCGKEVKGKSIGERTEYPIHFSTKFILCSECQKKIRQDLEKDLLDYETQKVIEWVRKKKDKVKSYILRGVMYERLERKQQSGICNKRR